MKDKRINELVSFYKKEFGVSKLWLATLDNIIDEIQTYYFFKDKNEALKLVDGIRFGRMWGV